MHSIRVVAVLLVICGVTVQPSPLAGQLDEWRSIARPETLDVFLKDRLVGTLLHSLNVDDTGLRVESSMSIRGGADAGARTDIDLFERRLYGADGALRAAYQRLSGESGTNEWKLEKSAKGWLLTIIAGGIASSVPVASVRENLVPTLKLYKSIQASRCRAGDVFTDTAFELVSQKNVATIYRCVAAAPDRKRWTFDVVDDIAGRSQTWELDADARTLSQEIEGVFVAKKRDNNPSKTPHAAAVALSEFADIFSVKKDRPPDKTERIAVTFQNGLSPDSSVAAFYHKHADRWILTGLAESRGSAASQSPDTSFSGSAWTKPTVTIQSDYPAIVSLARRLKAGRRDRCAVIDTCNRYVFLSLVKRNSATFSSAVETLKAGFGDCGEHAVLLAAILRAAGIPARVVLGLLYYAPKKAFVGHAWVMAFAGGKWIFCDPAFGVIAPTHDRVPLIIDDNGAHAPLLTKYIGRIGIEYSTP
jgi:transglutaminase-like putative cysteine protease